METDEFRFKEPSSSKQGHEFEVLLRTRRVLLLQMAENEEKLRKLHLVQKHRYKTDPENLGRLIVRWRAASQEAARQLHDALPHPKPEFAAFIKCLQIEESLLKYDANTDTFNEP